ncbi:MAG: hypothetical protein KZQ99_20845 [Candidatus Thiodiazotropha sp. (ex Dulcina madagascariensis)]|nr:hypothetical protein [Candidatus Thiodiazotropha sp. (ex Dulcina madagascariensis)]
MKKNHQNSGNQLPLDFSQEQSYQVASGALRETVQSRNIVSFVDAVNSRANEDKENILDMFASYASKLNWK